MIVLNLKLNNIYGFKDFNIDFSYPKKIVNSLIEDEFLDGRPKFRYKKAIVLMGANATGKTSLGKTLLGIVNFINSGDIASLNALTLSVDKATFQIDFVNEGYVLHRLNGELIETENGKEVDVQYSCADILPTDSYEKCRERLSLYETKDYTAICKSIGKVNYTFSCPDIKPTAKVAKIKKSLALKTLRAVIGTLDPTLTDVSISKDLRNSFIIRRNREEIIIQDGKLLNRESLSSGTAEGVDISFFLALLMEERDGFYYCDEHFSYIQSDIEKRIFGLMLEHLGCRGQLIFTTHNTDMLDLNLPKHAFAFLRKKEQDGYNVNVTYASDILKRNTDSIRCAVENDVFSSLPDESLLDLLETRCDDEE